MKQLYIYSICFFLLSPLFCFSQEKKLLRNSDLPIENRKHELKIGALKVMGLVLDIEYEQVLTKYSSFGGNVVIGLESDGYFYDFSLSPFFRMYFTETREYGFSGFFAQAFLGYYVGEDTMTIFDSQKFNVLGMGFGCGKKWVNKLGFIFQVVLGGGRTFSSGNSPAPGFVVHSDVYIGYRF